MAKHDWRVDEAGDVVVVSEYPGYPYCCYIECVRCDETFCDNGCDGKIFEEECPNGQLELFSISEVL